MYPQLYSAIPFEIEHSVAEKHGGTAIETNLALACLPCNRFKGSDLGSLDPFDGKLTLFYNPRIHKWSDHFNYQAGQILPLTAEARVTVKIFQFNLPDRVLSRDWLGEAEEVLVTI